MNKDKNAKTVVVTGDVTIDWNIARIRRGHGPTDVWNADDITCAFGQRGGAAMLADLVAAVAKNLPKSHRLNVTVRKPPAPRGRPDPHDPRFPHSYAVWAPFDSGSTGQGQKHKVWRVSEFLGLYQESGRAGKRDKGENAADDPAGADLVIVDDANLGFRDSPAHWPQALADKISEPWVLLKMARPVGEGQLWDHLLRNHAGRLIVVMTADDLRLNEVHISRQISWERTAQDVTWELLFNPQVSALAQCAHVVVSFGTTGAALLSRRREGSPEARLFFDPNAMEGEWGRDQKGYMVGYTTCLATGIARELLVSGNHPDLERGIQSGVSAMRLLHAEGYGSAPAESGRIRLAFPASLVAEELVGTKNPLAVATVRIRAEALSEGELEADGAGPPPLWTILEAQNPDSLEDVARRIVVEGLENTLSGVPVGRFGKLKTVDRREIEALHSISTLIQEYCQGRRTKPLSIAVFGPPGAGKSFAVKEVANSVRPGEIESLSFNLAQFGSPGDLLDAYHQVRDKVLSGKIPLVFWDEFDTTLDGQPLGWLRYFLAPMQDGEFLHGQLLHPIGQSIFVFAGGTCHSMEDFASMEKEEIAVSAKLPDFISRLRGFLNILGPNRQAGGYRRGGDPYYIIRRAIMLRTIFERLAPQLLQSDGHGKALNIDKGLLNAFLLVSKYKHGVRSMESIVTTSQLSGKSAFERSSLPPEAQLSLHVDGREFFALMHSLEPDEKLLEKLAAAAHEVFCDDLRAQGYTYGPTTIKSKKVHSSLRPYAELPEDEKAQNRNNVRDIPNKLAAVGCAMLPARGDEDPQAFEADEVETVAKMEHHRWMQQKLADGWKTGKRTVKRKKLHKDLLSWEQLPDEEREKDRALVRGIPGILAEAGYVMIKLQ